MRFYFIFSILKNTKNNSIFHFMAELHSYGGITFIRWNYIHTAEELIFEKNPRIPFSISSIASCAEFKKTGCL